MVIEMFDSYKLMDVGNCVLFIDDEIQRRAKVAKSAGGCLEE